MNPEYPADPSQSAHHQDVANPISSMQANEQPICQITRHPIGMMGIYIMAGLLLIVVAVLSIIVAPHLITNYSHSKVLGIGAVVFIVVALLVSGFVFISNKVYWGNRWFLTTDSLTQIAQLSLFDKQSSQLSLGNLEDVTVEQNGILPHMFNFGLLRVETAGERSKFVFPFCPNPNAYAQKILSAREAFEQSIRQVGGVNQGVYPNSQQPQAPSYQQPVPVQAPAPSPYPNDPIAGNGSVNLNA